MIQMSSLKANTKNLSVALLFFFTAFYSMSQTFTPKDEGSKVKFVIKNFGINTSGTFQGLSGTIRFDPANLSVALFNVSVDAKTIDTDIRARDNHLRKPEYFDVDKYPKINIVSTKITRTNTTGYFYFYGNLMIKGVSKEISFPFTAISKDGGYLFAGEFKMNRRDFSVGSNSFSLSDELTVKLTVFANKN